MPNIVWFRRDLRLHDNTALYHACKESTDGIIPLFVFDDAILKHPDCGANIVEFMLQCLRELRDTIQSAGGEMIFLHGNPRIEIPKLVKQTKAKGVYLNKDYAPGAIERDENLKFDLEKSGVAFRQFKDQVIFEEEEILSAGAGTPYTVYTPYRKAWTKKLADFGFEKDGPPTLELPKMVFSDVPASVKRIELPTTSQLGFTLTATIEIPAGETAGRAMLRKFCAGPIADYKKNRNFPFDDKGTSRLSPHLRHGTLSPRQCLRAAMFVRNKGGQGFAEGVDTWIGELIWREFYQQILFNFPHVEKSSFKKQYDKLSWPGTKDDFEKWKAGQTGYPIVDAAMRQLNQTGWMHNRLRMIVAMFLTKHLLIDYRWGERYFMQNLVDGETAQNNGGWQWSSSTGTDAQPYFRIFNPVSQSESYDPAGKFIRRYCPELKSVPDEFIHSPWEMDMFTQNASKCIIGQGYPAPLVNHITGRERALNFFKTLSR